jgi:uncharacterized OsmC-like protein
VDNLRWNIRVRGSGKGQATVYARRHQFRVGAPVHFDEQYNYISALEYLLGAVGADIANGLEVLLRKRRVQVDGIEASVSGELNNALTYLSVVGEEGHPGLEKISIKVFVSSDEPEEEVQRVWEEVLEKSPLIHTFQSVVNLDLSMKMVI